MSGQKRHIVNGETFSSAVAPGALPAPRAVNGAMRAPAGKGLLADVWRPREPEGSVDTHPNANVVAVITAMTPAAQRLELPAARIAHQIRGATGRTRSGAFSGQNSCSTNVARDGHADPGGHYLPRRKPDNFAPGPGRVPPAGDARAAMRYRRFRRAGSQQVSASDQLSPPSGPVERIASVCSSNMHWATRCPHTRSLV
jgi:hypothetical protein